MSVTQDELETAILLMLAEEAAVSNRRLMARQIATKFTKPIGETQVQIALQHLTKIGLADGNFDNANSMGFQITRDGILRVEERFDRVDEGENTKYVPSPHSSGFDTDEISALADQGTYVFPVPPIDTSSSAAGTNPIIINNHVNPTFSNTVFGNKSDTPGSSGSAAWLSAWGTWATVLVAVAAILVTLYLAGKI